MVRASIRSRRHVGFRSSLLLLSAAILPLLAQPACGSDDGKKKAGPRFTDGGEGGELSSGGSSSPGEGGTSGNGGSAGTGNAGSAAGPSEGGSAGMTSGGGGEAGGSDEPSCPDGSADCDDDPSTCETEVTSFEECGACGVACQSVNGTTICGEVDGRTGCEVTSCTEDYGDCENDGTDGCETLLTSAQHCGFCDRNCGTQACTNKLCDPEQIGSALSAYRWARTADALYRITGSTPGYGLASNYVLTRTPLDGGAEVIMHSDAKNPGGLAVDDTSVYWAVNGTPSAVLKKAHAAAAVTVPTPVFETASIPVQMVIQGTHMYWTNQAGALFRRAMSAPLADGGTEIVSAADVKGAGTFNLHQDLVASPTALYWVVLPNTGNLAFIRTSSLTGASPADVSGAIVTPWTRLSLVGEDLYWTRATGSALDGAYHYAPGGDVEAPVLQANLNAVHATSDYLYLLAGANQMYRAPIAGGNSVQLGINTVQNYSIYLMDFAGSDATTVYAHTSFTHGAGFFTGGYKLFGYPL